MIDPREYNTKESIGTSTRFNSTKTSFLYHCGHVRLDHPVLAMRASACATGKSMDMIAPGPCGLFAARIVARWPSAIPRQIERPSHDPCSFVVRKGSNI